MAVSGKVPGGSDAGDDLNVVVPSITWELG
jgi:hypothetical protein